jgi:hypothetical protein
MTSPRAEVLHSLKLLLDDYDRYKATSTYARVREVLMENAHLKGEVARLAAEVETLKAQLPPTVVADGPTTPSPTLDDFNAAVRAAHSVVRSR